MKTNRRKFLGNLGIGTVGILGTGNELLRVNKTNFFPTIITHRNPSGILLPHSGKGENPRDIKINVKPVFYAMFHSGAWQGPCRFRGPGLGPKEEKVQARKKFDEWTKEYRNTKSQDVNLLEPAYFEFPEFVQIGQKDLLKLEADKEAVDLYLLNSYNSSSHILMYFVSVLAKLYKKPIAGIWSVHASYLRSIGVEGYVTSKYGGLNKLIYLLRARKVFQQTNMLLITDLGGTIEGPGYLRGSVKDYEDLNKRFGIGATIIGFKELSEERDKILKNRSRLKEVKNLTNRLIKNAQSVHTDKNSFMGDVLVFQTVKNLMEKYKCNAFSIECFEWCASRQPDMWKAIPCLTHSLLRDEGYPSACEGDISALLTLDLFMSLAKNSAYMGNHGITKKGKNREWENEKWIIGADTEGEKVRVAHNVPGLKMLSFDKPDLPYELMHFIRPKEGCDDCEGWGGTIKIDFTKIKEKIVTIGRLNPLTTKMLITKGEVVGMRGFDNPGCSTGAIININNPKSYQKKLLDYGHHFAMAYGDYTKDLIHLGDILGIEIDFHC
jgi:hypothetical protein